MALEYLKIEPEEAIKILSQYIANGYQIKEAIDYDHSNFPDKRTITNEMISKWRGMNMDWANLCLEKLNLIFVSEKESYNFKYAPVTLSVWARKNDPDINLDYYKITKQLDARINKLNEYDSEIKKLFNIKVEVVFGDKITQSGNKNKLEIKN